MRLLNLDLDDLYLLSTNRDVASSRSTTTSVLEMTLGDSIKDELSNSFFFGSKDFSQTIKSLGRSSYSVKSGYDKPLIWDERVRLSDKQRILFSGVYTKDCKSLLDNAKLLIKDYRDLSKVKVIAGGYKQDQEGVLQPNLVLVVPQNIFYIVDNTAYSCMNDSLVNDAEGEVVTLRSVLNNITF